MARGFQGYFRAKLLKVWPLNGTYSRVLLYERAYKHIDGLIKAKESNARNQPSLKPLGKRQAFPAQCRRDVLTVLEAYDLGGPLITADKAFLRAFGPDLLPLGIQVFTVRTKAA